MKAYLDANVILRFLTNDHADQSKRATDLFASVEAGKIRLIVLEVVLAEVVWTLESFYGKSRSQIASQLTALLSHDGIIMANKPIVLEALLMYDSKKFSFADALQAAYARVKGPAEIYSFDQGLDRVKGVRRVEP